MALKRPSALISKKEAFTGISFNKLTDASLSDSELLYLLTRFNKLHAADETQVESVIPSLLQLKWRHRPREVHDVYLDILRQLLYTHKELLGSIYGIFMAGYKTDRVSSPTTNSPEKMAPEPETQEEDKIRIDKCVASVCRIIEEVLPYSTEIFIAKIEQSSPHVSATTYVHSTYVYMVLQLWRRFKHETLRDIIFKLLLSHLLRLDVACAKADYLAAEEVEEIEGLPVSSASATAKALGGTLDQLMAQMFLFIEDFCRPAGKLSWQNAKQLFKVLLLFCDRSLLRTYNSAFVQFLLFFVCSLHRDLAASFFDFLWRKVTDPNTEMVFRKISAAYIGSFLARASFLPVADVLFSLNLMSSWAHEYSVNVQTRSDDTTDSRAHSHYFAVCQTIFYVVAFLHDKFEQADDAADLLKKLQLQSICSSPLNPLRYCLPIVARTLANICRMHQLAFLDTILERNRRQGVYDQLLWSKTVHEGSSANFNPLSTFFPFDPYVLPLSEKFVQPLYREFSGTLHEDEEEDEAAEVELASSPIDLELFGTSPGFCMSVT